MSNSEESVSAEENQNLQDDETDATSGEEDIESGDLPEESANVMQVTSKKATVRTRKITANKNPTFMSMIIEAVTESDDKKGASVPAIKTYIQNKYSVGESTLKQHLKKGVLKGLENEVIFRPNSSKDNKGLTGRFKVNPEYLKTKRKEEKAKNKKAAAAAKKSASTNQERKNAKKARRVSFNGKELKSLGEKSFKVKAANEIIKEARKSIGTPKAAVPRKRVLAATVNAKTKAPEKAKKQAKTNESSTSKSPKAVAKPKASKKSDSKNPKGSTKERKKEGKATADKKKAISSKAGESTTKKAKAKKK